MAWIRPRTHNVPGISPLTYARRYQGVLIPTRRTHADQSPPLPLARPAPPQALTAGKRAALEQRRDELHQALGGFSR